MLEIHAPLDELFVYVTGYEDGGDWLIGLPRPRGRVTGRAASLGGNDRYVWTALQGGGIAIYDALERRQVGMVTLPEPPLSVLLHGSRDGRHLYALSAQGRFAEARLELFVIVAASAAIVARHECPFLSFS